ncbi:hypothetical protein [Komagataeibacter sp. FNDCF1]|uniref:hypothetical protein n=1 Tax=Komagataeibacter sp. FNDCF1 TaxID=2878681 RepID=UPI001E47F7C2|nr:hypothetical protein [Komagataeibacter sp. FNDCF1]MCE2563660.1 hypothetical protein [Komagataeibacter sp. FNDCF1]
MPANIQARPGFRAPAARTDDRAHARTEQGYAAFFIHACPATRTIGLHVGHTACDATGGHDHRRWRGDGHTAAVAGHYRYRQAKKAGPASCYQLDKPECTVQPHSGAVSTTCHARFGPDGSGATRIGIRPAHMARAATDGTWNDGHVHACYGTAGWIMYVRSRTSTTD